jgi:SOS response regulatory protein OraA/RecX
MALEIRDELAEDGRPQDVGNSVVDAALAGSIIACVHGNGMTRLRGSLAERGVTAAATTTVFATGCNA